MLITVANAVVENSIFFVLLATALLIPTRLKKEESGPLPPSLSLELKGLAILTVIFGHIGYFLSTNHDFLFPLSTISGVGVDLFLLLSGYGLTISALGKNRSVLDFFKRNIPKLYLPLWITLSILFLADFFILGKSYGTLYVLRSFAGFFPNADLFNDVNSPLWYFTFIIVLYIIFRLTFSKRWPWASAIAITTLTAVFVWIGSHFISGSVIHLYSLHFLAFPLGVLLAWALSTFDTPSGIISKLQNMSLFIRVPILLILAASVWYLAMHTNITGFEQAISLLIVALILCFFFILKHHSLFLTLVGMYSFEIYLFHWPILYRYDILYKTLPAGIATMLYLCLFIILGYLFNMLSSRLLARIRS